MLLVVGVVVGLVCDVVLRKLCCMDFYVFMLCLVRLLSID